MGEEFYPSLIKSRNVKQACFYGFLPLIREIINTSQVDLSDCLYEALKGFQPEVVRFLLQIIPPRTLNIINEVSITTLWAAIKNSDLESLQLLVQAGANLRRDGCLSMACSYGNLEIVKFILDSGANINQEAFRSAVLSGNLAVVRLLNQRGIQERPRVLALGYPEIFRYLWTLGLRGIPTDLDNPSQEGFNDQINLLLDFEVPLNDPESKALQLACWNGRVETVRLLLERGADPNWGEPLAHLRRGFPEIVLLLLSYGADPNIQNGAPLKGAVSRKEFQSLEYLIRFGANPNIGDAFLLSSRNLEIFKFMMSLEINLELKEKALTLAIERGDLVVSRILLESPNPPDIDLALIFASTICQPDIVRMLIYLGADVNFQNNLALYRAATNGCLEIVWMLLVYGAQDPTGEIQITAERLGYREISDLLRFG